MKLQQFYIRKISSDRLKERNFNIKQLSLEQARLNGEAVSIANSELIRSLFRITEKKFSQIELNLLWEERQKLTRKKNTQYNRTRLTEINKQIDDILYIPELVSIEFVDKRHYGNIVQKGGFKVEGKLFLPFLASAGMIRRNTALFIDSSIKNELLTVFNNERDLEQELVPAKFNAYLALYASSSFPVSFPRIAVVPDKIIKTVRKVDYSIYNGEWIDPTIEEREMELECNSFDGQGLISPHFAKLWKQDLELTYVPSTFIVRSPFLKGMLVTFDFHKFAEQFGVSIFKDVYGKEINIENVDALISESQFKLWESYSSTEDYLQKCEKNKLGWGITHYAPKEDKTHARSSYQFLQVLNLKEEDIKLLCEPTLNWLKNVSGGGIESVLLFLLGDMEFSDKWFQRMEPLNQALLLENGLINDSYLLFHLDNNISKKKTDAKMGRLLFSGNYSVMIADPYYQAAHVFGINAEPLLKDGEHYSRYWNERGVKQIAGIRSPIVHSSEVNLLNLQETGELNDWFQYINSGIIFPAYGVGLDAAINGGSDFDGDTIATIDNQAFINGKIDGLPVLYNVEKAEKYIINSETENLLIESQMRGFNSKVGFLTNISSSLYAMLENFEEGSHERNAILNRLKYGRCLQGLIIDSAKGIKVDPFPEHFVKYKNPEKIEDLEAKELQIFYNRILANKRPLFMRWLYKHYNQRYRNEITSYDNISRTKWGMGFEELKESQVLTDDQKELLEKYKRRTFFIDNASTMNKISKYVEKELRSIKFMARQQSQNFDYTLLMSIGFRIPDKTDVDKMRLLYKEYKSLKRNLRENHNEYNKENYSTIEQILSHINKKAYSAISSSASELADLAVYLCYQVLGKNSKSFAWQVFGREIVQNIVNKKDVKYVRVPQEDKDGKLEYLWKHYSMQLISIESQ